MLSKQLKIALASAFAIYTSSNMAQEISLEQAMADPDWIGRAPERPYWSDDSESIYYLQKQEGAAQRNLFNVQSNGSNLTQIAVADIDEADVRQGKLSNNGRLKVYSRSGDVYVKNLRNSQINQLTRTASTEASPYFTMDDEKIIFYRDGIPFVRHLETGLESQAAIIKSEKSPEQILAEEDPSYLESQQPRLLNIIRLQKERAERARLHNETLQLADDSRISTPYYLGEEIEVLSQLLSPNENWLALVIANKSEETIGRRGSMPNYVTASGYTENRELRSRVGTTDFANQRIVIIDLLNRRMSEIDFSTLPDITNTPLQDQLGIEPESEEDIDEEKPRELRHFGLSWTNNGQRLLFNSISRDNKDRWILTLNTGDLVLPQPEEFDFSEGIKLENDALRLAFHEHDPAWISTRDFIESQWLDNDSLFFLSEQDGYGHLYQHSNGANQQLTQGRFEIREPTPSRDGKQIYFRSNIEHPTVYEIYRLTIANNEIETLTDLGGMNRYTLSPDESQLLISHSEASQPDELFVQRARPGATATQITQTISTQFASIDWAEPEFIEVRSSFSEDPIHSRVYTPTDSSRNRPAVVFIHGAGYLQNAHQGWSGYFREFMFHSFLVQQGYVVLDMDYRASMGYGRDWRTAIYQQMGTPEVQDIANGIDFLVANKNVDRARVCAYGGSYGGFLTLMSMFKKPDLLACGAALRPVTDWATYNHGYTSNILNIPELDPASFERSSPIEFAEGLEKPLLIAHGMQDDNVFFQDSVRLVQRLIELEKEDFEMAIYPIEPHGFREASSWLDEYRRIYKLVNETIN